MGVMFAVMPNYVQHVQAAVAAITAGKGDDVDYNDFVYAAQLVYDGTRDIRRAVLMNRVCTSHTLLCDDRQAVCEIVR